VKGALQTLVVQFEDYFAGAWGLPNRQMTKCLISLGVLAIWRTPAHTVGCADMARSSH
jgi:hypothetical protein